MKFLNHLVTTILVLGLQATLQAQRLTTENPHIIYTQNFDHRSTGGYTNAMLLEDWGVPSGINLNAGHGYIVSGSHADGGNGSSLRIKYAANRAGGGSGTGWTMPFGARNDVYLRYRIKVNSDFNFVMGGKLPGLAGNKGGGGCISIEPGHGFSARYMWRDAGRMVGYLYWLDKTNNCGQDFAWRDGSDLIHLQPGVWHTLESRIVLNTKNPDGTWNYDGKFEAWFDGQKVLSNNSLRWRVTDHVQVDKLAFSTFFGGSTSAWAPTKDEYITYDDFLISTKRIDPNTYDTDSDGIEDAWELTHFGNLSKANSSTNNDDDHFTDLQEFNGDTNPNHFENSAPEIKQVAQFELPPYPEGTYRISPIRLDPFDAAECSKLVVAISIESKNSNPTQITSMHYNDRPLVRGAWSNAGVSAAEIWYLDNPGPISGGTITVSAPNLQSGWGTAFALNGTLPGIFNTNSNSGSTINSVNLTTGTGDAFVISTLTNQGNPNLPNTANNLPVANAPLTPTGSGEWGIRWGGHASGYLETSGSTSTTSSFTTPNGSGYTINIATAEFRKSTPLTNPPIKVLYHGNGYTGNNLPSDTNTYTNNSSVSIPTSPSMTRTGYTFTGWNTKPDGSGSNHNPGETFNINTSNNVLYAQWLIDQYTISYHPNGASAGTPPNPQTKTFNTPITTPSNPGNLARTGYRLIAWNTSPSGNGTRFPLAATYTREGNITLYAEWNAPPSVNAGDNQTIGSLAPLPWTPDQISPQGWYDASDNATVISSSGFVSQWNDKSGNDRHATQPTTTARPIHTPNTINNLHTLTFDGSNDFLQLDLDYLANQSHSTFAVIKNRNYSYIYGAATPNVGTGSFYAGHPHLNGWRMGHENESANFWILSGYTRLDFNIVNLNWNSSLAKTAFSNGSLQGQNNNSFAPIGSLAGGGRISGVLDQTFLEGEIGEIIFLTGDLSDENRQRMEGYLAHKWGLQAQLPSNHPHLSEPPSALNNAITLNGTASDLENEPLSIQWSLVSGPGQVDFTTPNQLTTEALLTKPGTYILQLSVDDGHGPILSSTIINVGDLSPYQSWIAQNHQNTFSDTMPDQDPDKDNLPNLLEFAFGMDPTTGSTQNLTYTPGGNLVTTGTPNTINLANTNEADDFHAVFPRRKDHLSAGITYQIHFSCDLIRWTTINTTPTTLTSPSNPGNIEAVSVPFPATVPDQNNQQLPPQYFRISVTEAN